MLGDRYWGITPQMDEEGDENNKVVSMDNRLYFILRLHVLIV